MRTERDKRSIAFFTRGYYLEEEGKYDEAIEAFEKSIEYIDTEMRSTAAFLHLYSIYRERKDWENMRKVLNLGIEYANYFNDKKANELIEKYPEHKEGILEALETNKPYPENWLEIGVNPLFRPHDAIFLIDLLIYTDEYERIEYDKKYIERSISIFERICNKYNAKEKLPGENFFHDYKDLIYDVNFIMEQNIKNKNRETISDKTKEIYLHYYVWLIKTMFYLGFDEIDFNRIVKFVGHNSPINSPTIESIKEEYDEEME